MRGRFGRAILGTVVAALVLVAAPAAHADIRYAEPGAGGADTACPESDPCDLQEAVESAANGDEVVVTPGAYIESDEVSVPSGVNVHGTAGAIPVIASTASSEAVEMVGGGGDSRLADLVIVYGGTANGVVISNGNLGERLYARSAGTVGCNVIGATLRDSVCWSTADSGNGIFNSNTTPISVATTLRNVTAIGSGTGSDGMDFTAAGGLSHVVDARNVIASGTDFDVNATAGAAPASTMTVNLQNSNYATRNESGDGASVTDPGSPTNQTVAPLFVDRAAGDFHQAAGSPTIDAGTTAGIGAVDLDGEARNQGAAPDIGADEFTVAAEQPPPVQRDNFPPDTGIRDGPKKKSPKRKVKFEFGGSEPGVTFECRLDAGSSEGEWHPCTSPHKIRGLRRKTKYVFSVRAVDGAGNPDPTPADRKWKVIKKRG